MVFKEIEAPFGSGFGKWHVGQAEFDDGRDLKVSVKTADEPSERHGVDGGKIVKLEIRAGTEVVASYDRGWDVEVPEEARGLYAGILREFN